MAATATYKQFLASPSAAVLTPTASLYYITTGTSFMGADNVLKHFTSLRPLLKKKKENILCSIEGNGAIAAEVETEIEFLISGAAYLPGMDENFLSDRTVSLPIMHIVVFEDDKIGQIRLTWDQGALLKQLDVIGRTGRNWPIRDGKEQLSTIVACLRKVAAPANGTNSNSNKIGNRARDNPNGCFVHNDPHASLVLFGPREEIEKSASVVSPYAGTRPAQRAFAEIIGDEPDEQPSAVVSPYAGQRPKQRSFGEILADEDDESQDPPSPSAGRGRSGSPSKTIAPKAGSSKNFTPNRLFDGVEYVETEDDLQTTKPQRFSYRPNPSKYEHFDFTDGLDPTDTPKPGVPVGKKPKTKNGSSWSFDEPITPAKPQLSKAYRHQDRHWDMENDQIQETPNPRPHAPPKPRPDADAHFELQDDGPDATPRAPTGKPRGSVHNERLHIYDHGVGNEGAAEPDSHPLSNITNLKDRQKNFVPHFNMVDESPAPKQNTQTKQAAAAGNDNEHGIKIAGDGMGGRKGTDRSWMYGGDAAPIEKITIAGDGMGGRRGRDTSWQFDSEQEEQEDNRNTGVASGTRKGADSARQKNFGSHFNISDESPAAKENAPIKRAAAANKGGDDRGIKIAGDGMGGRKGTGRDWLYGEESSSPPKATTGKNMNSSTSKSSSFSWDF